MKTLTLMTVILILFSFSVSAHDYNQYCDDVMKIGTLHNSVYANGVEYSVTSKAFSNMMNERAFIGQHFEAFDEKRKISALSFMASGVTGLLDLFYILSAQSGGVADVGIITAGTIVTGIFLTSAIWNYGDSNDDLYKAVHEYNRFKCGEPLEFHDRADASESMVLSLGTSFSF